LFEKKFVSVGVGGESAGSDDAVAAGSPGSAFAADGNNVSESTLVNSLTDMKTTAYARVRAMRRQSTHGATVALLRGNAGLFAQRSRIRARNGQGRGY
jgi:hypothetical protein